MNTTWFVGRSWIRAVARCLLQAAHFVHVQQLVHCDIHAHNVMARLVKDEMVPTDSVITFKLGDFGLARIKNALDPNGVFLAPIRPPEAITRRRARRRWRRSPKAGGGSEGMSALTAFRTLAGDRVPTACDAIDPNPSLAANFAVLHNTA
jgi:serine/threonine protein kinase